VNLNPFWFWNRKTLSLGLFLSLSLVGASALGARPAGFAYVANSSSGAIGNVSAYTINATTGALTPVPGSPFAAGGAPVSVTTTAPASRCKHDDEERDRDERGDGDEHSEGHEQGEDHEQGDGGHKGHKKHGCHHSGEMDFEEHDNDKMHESERGR
jgi:hypothetical protein